MANRAGLSDVLTAFGIISTLYAISQAVDRKKTIAEATKQFAMTQQRLDSLEAGIRSLHYRLG